jgi:hypothetical protein
MHDSVHTNQSQIIKSIIIKSIIIKQSIQDSQRDNERERERESMCVCLPGGLISGGG